MLSSILTNPHATCTACNLYCWIHLITTSAHWATIQLLWLQAFWMEREHILKYWLYLGLTGCHVGSWGSVKVFSVNIASLFLSRLALSTAVSHATPLVLGKVYLALWMYQHDQVEEHEKAGEKLLFPQNWLSLQAKNIFEPLQKGELRGKLPHPNLDKPPALIKASLHWAWLRQFGSKTILHKWK